MEQAEKGYFNHSGDEWINRTSSIKEQISGERGELTNALKFFMYSLARKRKLTGFLELLCRYSGNTQELLCARLKEFHEPDVLLDGTRPSEYSQDNYTPFLFIVSSHTVFADNIYQDMLYLESGSAYGDIPCGEKTNPDCNFWIGDDRSKSAFLLECSNCSNAPGMRRLYSLITGGSGLDLRDIGTLNFSEDNIVAVTWKQIYLTLNNPSFSKSGDEELAFLIEKMKIPMYRAGIVKEPGEISLRNMDMAESLAF